MSKQQAKWASQHDWFLSMVHSEVDGWVVIVRDALDNSKAQTFTNFSHLYVWAGY